jgi:integrase/recombinase XerD
MPGKQAKVLSLQQEHMVMRYASQSRYPLRDLVMVLLSLKAGLRAHEMAKLTWAMVMDADGQIGSAMHLPDAIVKQRYGRTIPLHPALADALRALKAARTEYATPEHGILFSERGGNLNAATVRLWFHRTYTTLRFVGCSSHSGRRTFITRAARALPQVGGSLRDVQRLAGHVRLDTTQRYIDSDTEVQRRLVAII